MADTFTRDRLEWLEAIASDGKVSAGAFRLAFVISSHLNRKTGEAWPGIDRLAKTIGTNERTIRRLIEELVVAAYLGKKRGGDGRPNRYWIAPSDRTKMSDQNESRPDKNVQPESSRSDNIVQSEKSRPDISRHSDRTFNDIQTGQKCPPNPLIEPSEETTEVEESIPPQRLAGERHGYDDHFASFWRVYPKQVDRADALKAWKRVIRGGTAPEVIIRGAARYAVERCGKDAQYTADPDNWLLKERWTDAPADGTIIDADGREVSDLRLRASTQKRSAFEIASSMAFSKEEVA